MIERAALPLKEMALESEGIVDVTKGVITYKRIIHKPAIALYTNATDEAFRKLQKLVYNAEKSCMISRALRGNVEIEIQFSGGIA
jgi:peroxiredoxin-like protein